MRAIRRRRGCRENSSITARSDVVVATVSEPVGPEADAGHRAPTSSQRARARRATSSSDPPSAGR